MRKSIKCILICFWCVSLLSISPGMVAVSPPYHQASLATEQRYQLEPNKELTTQLLVKEDSYTIKIFPDGLETGDLLFFDFRPLIALFEPTVPGFSNDHVVMYAGRDGLGRHMFVESSDYTFFDLPFRINGVQKTCWSFFLCYADPHSMTLGKVQANESQKQQAVQFISSHRGEHYQRGWYGRRGYETWHANPVITNPMNPYYTKYNQPNDTFFNQWTCAELVWAAYLNQGIELDSTPIREPDPNPPYNNTQSFFFVGTDDLRNSENITLYPF